LVIAEHTGNKLNKSFYKILTATEQLKEDTHLLVSGENTGKVLESIK